MREVRVGLDLEAQNVGILGQLGVEDGSPPAVLLLGAALDVLPLELDCALVQAPINTAMTTAHAAMEPVSFRESIGELLVSVASSEAAGHRPGCVGGDLDQLLGQRRGTIRTSSLLRRVGRQSGSHRGCLSGISASGHIRLLSARVLQFPLAGRRIGRSP